MQEKSFQFSVVSVSLNRRAPGFSAGVLETDRHRVDALQSDPQHVMNAAVGVGGFEKADTAVVSVANQARKAFLPKLPLYPAGILVPVPKASRVTFTLLLPSVTQSVASRLVVWAPPMRENAAAPRLAARKSRRAVPDMLPSLGPLAALPARTCHRPRCRSVTSTRFSDSATTRPAQISRRPEPCPLNWVVSRSWRISRTRFMTLRSIRSRTLQWSS